MKEREVYPNAPLVSVSFELRHPQTETLNGRQRALIKERLAGLLPVMRSQQAITQMVEIGPAGAVPHAQSEEYPKYFDRKMTIAASLLQGAIIVETTQYPGWEVLSEILLAVCEARHESSPIDGVERIGLRYIDEIRIFGVDDPNWSEYLIPSLLGPQVQASPDLPLNQWQGASVYGPSAGRSLVVRHATGDGYAIDPSGELRHKTPAYPGKFFMLDLDSFWVPEVEVPVFSMDLLREYGEALHAPVREMFENCITEKLREEVLRK
ncbi:TIGR04255 family protein [Arthrobacter sp. A2-55]|uniref:TIGR04255 family protein n=1 Tax=Arthrobacter sp. A2-55 TaxID=2897337 RepID=UPI0021CDA4D6|nr:TIGR04255 family protein [Arthrobacter sp. A2-55]MCU6479894.1 TIGR04255 family protein [Arthrobacter sp. A2-55]